MSCCHLSAHGSLDVSHIANGNPRHHRSRLRTVPHRTLLTAPPPFSTSDSRRTSLGILLFEKNPLSFVRPIVAYGRGCIECPVGAQNIGTHQAAVADAAQEIGLARFERDQATEDMEHVHQLRGVLGKPAVGLDPFERGRRAPVADDGPGDVPPILSNT